jgi:hypothetical protein
MKSLSKVSIKKEHEYTLDIEAGDKPLGACRGIINIRFRGNGKMGDEEEFAVAHFPDNFERGFITTFDVVEPKVNVCCVEVLSLVVITQSRCRCCQCFYRFGSPRRTILVSTFLYSLFVHFL